MSPSLTNTQQESRQGRGISNIHCQIEYQSLTLDIILIYNLEYILTFDDLISMIEMNYSKSLSKLLLFDILSTKITTSFI